MATKRINENPSVVDTILFDILTPDASDCFIQDPYKINYVKIYHVSRDFQSGNFGEHTKTIEDANLLAQLQEAKAAACVAPTEDNLALVDRLQSQLTATSSTETFYYKEAISVLAIGDDTTPAWNSSDTSESLLTHVTEDENGDVQFGVFTFEWEPLGMREGDYFICWNWTPNIAGDSISAHNLFSLSGSTQLTTSIPTHFTNPEKYEILQERYLPEMFKMSLSDNDLTPEVLSELNNAVAKGFTFLEDLGNQILDLIDSNATHESLLPLLAILFNLKLKTNDPTLWRRQIKRAMPLFKKKGTLTGLTEALAQADVSLTKFTPLWQVISQYTYQESFLVSGESEFTLTNTLITPLDEDNFGLWIRYDGEDDYTEINSDYVNFSTVDGVTTMIWVGDELSTTPISLTDGDIILVLYQISTIPGAAEQTVEDYIRTLPLSDQRDELDQDYPSKNWNVRVIEEDDSMFDVVIPTRHPFMYPLVYGQIRTEFPYSENIYNMEEYNGSKRDSTNPCHINKDFVDPCGACRSSKFVLDVEIEELSNDRIIETQEVIQEYIPFHARLHSLNLSGSINEFIPSPQEDIEILITHTGEEVLLAGNGQFIFNRTMEAARLDELKEIKRDALTDVTTEVSSASGTAYNSTIVLTSIEVRFDSLALNKDDDSKNVLEIFAPHAAAGSYSAHDAYRNHIEVDGITEPFSTSMLTFRLSNNRYENSSVDITQEDIFNFSDEDIDFAALSTQTTRDVTDGYATTAWTVEFTSSGLTGEYTIEDMLPDGSLILTDSSPALPTTTTSSISYILKDDSGDTIATGTEGVLTTTRRAKVDASSDTARDDLANFIQIGDYFLEDSAPTVQYRIMSFVANETHQFYIENYTDGDSAGVAATVYRRLANNNTGFLAYKGLELSAAANHESGLDIQNGTNPPADPDDVVDDNKFKENFLVLINSEYFAIKEIDGSTITLDGPHNDWTTLVAGGTAVTYDILKFSKIETTIEERTEYAAEMGYTFEQIDRRGNEVITVSTETATPLSFMSFVLNQSNKGVNETVDTVSQHEHISFEIEYRE